MVANKGEFCLLMKVRDGRSSVAASGHPQSSVLDTLELILARIAGVGGPNCSSVAVHRFDIGLVSAQHHFLLAAPTSASQGAKSAELSTTRLNDFGTVGAEVEVGVKFDSKDARVFVEGDWLAIDEDLRMKIGLPCFVGSEKRDGAFFRCDTQRLRSSPRDNSINVGLKTRFDISNLHSRSTKREVVCIRWLVDRAVTDEEIEQNGAQDGALGHPSFDVTPRRVGSLPDGTGLAST